MKLAELQGDMRVGSSEVPYGVEMWFIMAEPRKPMMRFPASPLPIFRAVSTVILRFCSRLAARRCRNTPVKVSSTPLECRLKRKWPTIRSMRPICWLGLAGPSPACLRRALREAFRQRPGRAEDVASQVDCPSLSSIGTPNSHIRRKRSAWLA